MKAPRIHFAHAAGFPSLTYSKLFDCLRPDFEIGFIRKHAHNPDYPVTDNWELLAVELADELSATYDEPVIGVGHSLGGVLHLLAAVKRPELYSSIVLLDAPIISRLSSFGLKVMKRTGLLKRYPPASTTRFRRRVFQSREEALDYFRSKKNFAGFAPEVLSDYVEYGLEHRDGMYRLVFEPEIEAQIYSTIPHHLPSLKGRLPIPFAYIGGTDSYEARLARLGFMRRNFPVRFRFVPGTHLFPFENPEKTAASIRAVLADS